MPALLSVDPKGANGFRDGVVFGRARRVFLFGGNATPPQEQGGLTLNFPPTVPINQYSAEMVFRFHARVGAWRRILDVQNRVSDSGFYVDPGNTLDVYPVAGSTSNFVNNVYHHVVLTVANDGTIRSYLDGVPQFTIKNNTQMYVANPAGVMHLFLDNTSAGGIGEYSPGEIALFRLYGGVLSPGEVSALAGVQGPTLRVEARGTDAVLSWPSLASDYHLEANAAFEDGPKWIPVSGLPQTVADRLELVQPTTDAQRFYRLAK